MAAPCDFTDKYNGIVDYVEKEVVERRPMERQARCLIIASHLQPRLNDALVLGNLKVTLVS